MKLVEWFKIEGNARAASIFLAIGGALSPGLDGFGSMLSRRSFLNWRPRHSVTAIVLARGSRR
jgi:hypothetical protein